jgi:hypothetical protein
VSSGSVPIDDTLRGMSWLELLGLQVADEESRHEECGRGNQQQFQGGEGTSQSSHATLYSTKHFALQSYKCL